MEFSKRKVFVLLSLAAVVIFLMFRVPEKDSAYLSESGRVFGTFYKIKYEAKDGRSLAEHYERLFLEVDSSLSTFNKESIISRFNSGEDSVLADSHFRNVFEKGVEVSKISGGAFDMTVAQVVNAWGFGFSKRDDVSDELIDSLMRHVGYGKVRLVNGLLKRNDVGVMLDASAIAKGYSVDVVARCLDSLGVENYMVEIGGEISVKGVNHEGRPWGIGVTSPVDDSTMMRTELYDVVYLQDKAMATSGNYRQYYHKGGKKYSHTIDPRTGYPVEHNLLSASIFADDCMTADALATACMVVGLDSSMAMIESIPGVEGFFIYADSSGVFQSKTTPGFCYDKK